MQEDTANYSIYYSLQNLKDTFRDATVKRRKTVLQAVQNIRENNVPVTICAGKGRRTKKSPWWKTASSSTK